MNNGTNASTGTTNVHNGSFANVTHCRNVLDTIDADSCLLATDFVEAVGQALVVPREDFDIVTDLPQIRAAFADLANVIDTYGILAQRLLSALSALRLACVFATFSFMLFAASLGLAGRFSADRGWSAPWRGQQLCPCSPRYCFSPLTTPCGRSWFAPGAVSLRRAAPTTRACCATLTTAPPRPF